MTTKICAKCKVEKDITEFWRNSRRLDGHETQCADCINADRRNRRNQKIQMRVRIVELVGISHICRRCKFEKDLAEFHRKRRRKNGYAAECKACAAERDRARRYDENYVPRAQRPKVEKKVRRRSDKKVTKPKKARRIPIIIDRNPVIIPEGFQIKRLPEVVDGRNESYHETSNRQINRQSARSRANYARGQSSSR